MSTLSDTIKNIKLKKQVDDLLLESSKRAFAKRRTKQPVASSIGKEHIKVGNMVIDSLNAKKELASISKTTQEEVNPPAFQSYTPIEQAIVDRYTTEMKKLYPGAYANAEITQLPGESVKNFAARKDVARMKIPTGLNALNDAYDFFRLQLRQTLINNKVPERDVTEVLLTLNKDETPIESCANALELIDSFGKGRHLSLKRGDDLIQYVRDHIVGIKQSHDLMTDEIEDDAERIARRTELIQRQLDASDAAAAAAAMLAASSSAASSSAASSAASSSAASSMFLAKPTPTTTPVKSSATQPTVSQKERLRIQAEIRTLFSKSDKPGKHFIVRQLGKDQYGQPRVLKNLSNQELARMYSSLNSIDTTSSSTDTHLYPDLPPLEPSAPSAPSAPSKKPVNAPEHHRFFNPGTVPKKPKQKGPEGLGINKKRKNRDTPPDFDVGDDPSEDLSALDDNGDETYTKRRRTNAASNPSYKAFGTYFVSIPQLDSNFLRVSYASGASIPAFPSQYISNQLAKIISGVLFDGALNKRSIEGLDQREHALLSRLMTKSKLGTSLSMEKFTEDKDEMAMSRYHVLRGMIEGGNDSDITVNEFKSIVRHLMSRGMIKHAHGVKILAAVA